MLDSLVQVLPVCPYVKLSIWPPLSTSWLEDYLLDELFWPQELFSKNIFPSAQLTYLSQRSGNLLKELLLSCCLVSKEAIKVSVLSLDYYLISVSRPRAICLEPTTAIQQNKLRLNHRAYFNEFCNPLHSWYWHFKNSKG